MSDVAYPANERGGPARARKRRGSSYDCGFNQWRKAGTWLAWKARKDGLPRNSSRRARSGQAE